jgi:membrane protease YdiL (CAAX protease family)
MVSEEPTPESTNATPVPVAPAWHTVIVLLALALGSVASGYQHGLPNAGVPGMSLRLSGYLTVITEEWFLVLLIWAGLRSRGFSLSSLISGRWKTLWDFVVDLGLGIGLIVVAVLLISVVPQLLGFKPSPSLGNVTPKTSLELTAWLGLSATGGFCEEVIFRGYLMRQFQGWTGSGILAVFLQGIVFGLAHGYYYELIVLIIIHGWLLGLLAYWRKSLRPGMLAHGLQDALGGAVAFFS